VETSRRLRCGALVVSLELFFGGWNSALAQSSTGADGGAPQSSSPSEAPKALPEGSVFSSLQQSFKEIPDQLAVRGHFDLGAPPHVLRYYCLINIKTGSSETYAVRGDLAPRPGGITGIKNIAVSLYSCVDAQQQGLLVTSGYALGGSAAGAPAPAPAPQARAPAELPAPAAAAAATPALDGSPSRIDVGGVKLGMSPDDVRAVLKSKKLLDYDESAETLSYLDSSKGVMQPVANGRFVNVIAAWTPPPPASAGGSFQVDGESYEVMFTPDPGKERAMAIVHSVGYSPANAIREAALESGLVNKYGGFNGSIDLPEAPTWRLQSGGNVQVGDACNRRGIFGGLGELKAGKTARENLALKGSPEDLRFQIDRCGVAIVTEDHFTANGGALRADRLVTRYTVTAYSPSIASDGARAAAALIQAASGTAKKSAVPRAKEQPATNL
jgi:hypothetical protein